MASTGGWVRLSASMITIGASAGAAAPFNVLTAGKVLTKAQADALNAYSIAVHANLVSRIAFALDINNGTCSCNIFGGIPLLDATRTPTGQMVIEHLGVAALVAGTATGSSGSLGLTNGEKLCDQLAFTRSGIATTIPGPLTLVETAMNEGTKADYQATMPNNDIAFTLLPAIMRVQRLYFDFFGAGSSATTANAFVLLNEI